MPRIPNIHIRTDPGNLSSGSLTFYIKVDGKKAKRVSAFLDDFPGEVWVGSREGACKFANKLHRIIKRCLKTGTPPKGVSWPPHSEFTVKSLGAHKLLNLTGFYMRSIKVMDKGGTIAVGLPRGLKRPNNIKGSSTLTMKQIAQILEYGGNKVPARPLWRPAYNQVGGPAQLKKDITAGIRKQVRKSVQALESSSIYAKDITPSMGGNASYFDLIPPSYMKTFKPSSSDTDNFPDDLPF